FTADLGVSGQFGVGTSTTVTTANGPNGTLVLAGSNTITAGTVRVSYGSTNAGTSNLRLGTSNTINADNIYIATGKGAGNLLFNTGLSGPTVTIRGSAGGSSRVALFRVGDYSDYAAGGASTNSTGNVNFNGRSVDAGLT